MNYYVISISGYEEYLPFWFATESSFEDFRKTFDVAVEKALNKLTFHENYLDGHDIMKEVVAIMNKMGYKQLIADNEINIGGSCMYSDKHPPPENSFSKKTSEKILSRYKKMQKWVENG